MCLRPSKLESLAISTLLESCASAAIGFCRLEDAKPKDCWGSTLPEPQLNFSAFLSSIETREGPQLGLIEFRRVFLGLGL